MTDIDALLERLRAAAVEHGATRGPDQVPVRRWTSEASGGARRAVLDAWCADRPMALQPFLVPDAEGFVDLGFQSCLGRPPDPAARRHYLGRIQQGMPRLEVLAQLAGSPEAVKYRGEAAWPLHLRPLVWALRLPTTFARRATRALLRRLERRLGNRLRGGALDIAWRLAGAIDERDRAQQSAHDALARDSADLRKGLSATQSHVDDLSTQVIELRATVDASSKALRAMQARIAAAEYAAPVAPIGHPASTAAPSDVDVMRYYLTLESVFRGEPARIREQLATDYVQFVEEARNEAGDGLCIDLGCGRGEWLDVLEARGFRAQGVDLNAAMATVAMASGHDVTIGDALAFLRGLAGDSVLAISAFHLAEHLDFPTLFRLIGECRRVLKPRGLFILETPNPENIWVATHTFHHDPTHRNPLTPASLEFLVNHHGLETVAVPRLHPYPPESRLPGDDPVSERLNGMTCCGQDFAVVAKKTPPG
jgi:SAM-dependent methyltransferase